MNISFSDHMSLDKLDEEFLILNHDCFFSNSKEDPMTGEHWKMTDQRWQVPTKQDIPEHNYYCYNLQLVNLYNHTSLTFACNVCHFNFSYKYTPHFQKDYGSYKWDNGHILPNHVAYVGIQNLNHRSTPSRFFKKVFGYFIYSHYVSFHYRFQYVENDHYHYLRYGSLGRFFDYSPSQIIDSPNNVHFSEEDWLTEDGESGYFDRSKVHNLIWSKHFSVTHHPLFEDDWSACLEYALFANFYFTKYGNCVWVIAGGAWKSTDHFPYEGSSIYWEIYLSITNVEITPIYNYDTLMRKRGKRINTIRGLTDYSRFLQLDRKPDYILTSENELYWFYRSSVTFNFFNTDLINQVLMKKVNEGINQTLVLNHDYTLTKKAGCYQFLVTFHDYPYEYYSYEGGKTIKLNIRIIPDYDFSQGLNAVTLNYFSSRYHHENYSPVTYSDNYWVVDIYLDRKTVRQFYHWLKHSFLVTTQMLSFFNLNFKNFCSFNDLNGKDSIDHFQDNQLYKCLDDQMTHNNNRLYLEALQNAIDFFCIKNNKSGHLHFVLKKDEDWKMLNSGKFNTNHFYDKIVQPDQWK